MCGLFGFSRYGNEEIKGLSKLTNTLAVESAIRGTDATGIAFNNNGCLKIFKDSKSAYKIDFKHPDDVVALTGHTRHATQGSVKKNYNNHPFKGTYKGFNFALCHNGVLSNDKSLRISYTPGGTTNQFSSKALQEEDIETWRKYLRPQTRKGSIRITVREDEDNE